MTATRDTLLGGRVVLAQPARGYRAAIDPVLLAAAVEARRGGPVLDLGCGTGAVALCLMRRCPGLGVHGVDADPDAVAAARANAAANGLDGATFGTGDVADGPPPAWHGAFAQVAANPPHSRPGTGRESPHAGRRRADVEGDAPLAAWIAFALACLPRKGTLTVIHRADRMDGLLAALHHQGAGDVVMCPLWPRAGRPARRLLVRARKGVRGGASLAPGLVLHDGGRKYSGAAEAVLRAMAALDMTAADGGLAC